MNISWEGVVTFSQPIASTQLTRFNPPRLSTLSYRGAKYQNALARMLTRLPVEKVTPEDLLESPLAYLNVEASDDWAVALLHAWAVVTDVLTFYQERIINEGYLRTATEHRSVLELARSIGYEIRPGLAASTCLAFTVQVGQNEPPHKVYVPARTAVQGMSPTSQLPQVFETDQSFTAHSVWNFLKLASQDQPRTILPGTTSIRLADDRVNLQVDDQILIVGDDGAKFEAGRRWLLAILSQVQADPQKGYTLISWEKEFRMPGAGLSIHNARVFSLKKLGGLFGYTQAAVDYVSPASDDRRPAGIGLPQEEVHAVDYASPARDDWRPAGIGLPQEEVHALVSNQEGHLFAGTVQDVFRSIDKGITWQPAPTGPLRKNVTALAVEQSGALYAGTDEGGIYLSQDSGLNWMAMCGEAVVQPAKRLRKWLPFLFKAPLPKATVRTLVINPQRRKRLLVAGTDNGVFRSTDQGKTWQPSSFDLPGLDWKTGLTETPVWTLAMVKRGRGYHLFAGMDGGVFRAKGSPSFWPLMVLCLILVMTLRALSSKELLETLPYFTTSWRVLIEVLIFLVYFLLVAVVTAIVFFVIKYIERFINSRSRRCLGLPVYALAVGAKGQLYAGTAHGVYRSYEPRELQDGIWLVRLISQLKNYLMQILVRDWRLITGGSEVQDVRALMVTPSKAVLAGTSAGKVFRSNETGEEWYRFDKNLTLSDIQAILDSEYGQFVAGKPVNTKIEKRWSHSQIKKGQIDLDQVAAAITPRSWIVLQQGGESREETLYQVSNATITNSQDFNQPGQFTRLSVVSNNDLGIFDRERTIVWAEDAVLALYDDRPVCGDELILDRVMPDLETEHRLVFSGKRILVRLVGPDIDPTDKELILQSEDSLQSASLFTGELLQLMSPPQLVNQTDEQKFKWHLKNGHGFIGFVTAPLEAFVMLPATEKDETVTEVAVIKSVDHQKETTRIILFDPLENVYDRTSLTIYGNVIHATHGRTVRDEVLGSGDGLQANQSFRLRQGPLTFVGVPTTDGAMTDLNVQVNKVTWHQVPFLQGLAKDSRAYIMRQDAHGNTYIIFGDGKQGARLPSGDEQITATYRIGLGPDGNIPAGGLNQLQSAPQGIDSVINPLPATGGVNPEKLARVRQNAPLTVRTMGRIVSLVDYEDFIGRFASIGKVQARLLQSGTQEVIHITIADAEGKPVSKKSDLYRMILQAIEKNRDASQPQVIVDTYEPIYFNIGARLFIDPDHSERQQDIEAAVRSRISHLFAFDAREFGQDVSASKLISLIQTIPGVDAVQLLYLHLTSQKESVAKHLEASLARWQENRWLPAQMLLVKAQEGIMLELKVAI